MAKIPVGVVLCAATLLALTALTAPAAQHEAFTGHPPEPPPCPPCHCKDRVLDCTQVDLESPEGVLDIGGWNISGFGEVLLDGSPDLHELHELLSVPRDAFSLAVLPRAEAVRTLSLKYRGLVSIASGAFVGLPGLTTLDVSHNQLTADAVRADVLRGPWRSDSYEPLPIETLDLSHNSLHSLPHRALEHLAALSTLRLDGNPLKVLDRGTQAALAGATKLQVLSLSGCGLSVLPADLSSALPRGLLTLDLSRNSLASVPRNLPTSLHRLVLDDNPIRSLPEGDSLVPPFVGLDNLQELSLSYMPLLEDLKVGALFGMPRLRALSCSHNPRLERIHHTALSHLGPSWTLTEVSFRNNSLRWLDPSLLGWRGLTFVDLADNPWHCSCNFSSWAASTLTTLNVNTRADVRCSTPVELMGVSLLNATTAACSPSLREPVAPGHPSLFANAMVFLLTATLVASVVLLVRHLLGENRPGRLLGKAARVPVRSDSMKTPLYLAAPTEDRDDDSPFVFPGVPNTIAAVFVEARRGDL